MLSGLTIAKPILVTGCYRSGSTMIEKILNMHPSITVASQPFPVLYYMIKERFNQFIGIERRYPLDHLFKEHMYTPGEFNYFLKNHILDKKGLEEFSKRMDAYSAGLWTPEIIGVLDRLKTGSFFDIYDQLNKWIAHLFPVSDQSYVGGKEVLIEEYALPLIKAGTRVLFIVRDPRSVIASLNYKLRDNLTGDPRPILYSLRVWRKGVALAIAAVQRGGACMIRYEDLLLNEEVTLRKLTDFLEVSPYGASAFVGGIVDQYGMKWVGNSSFSDKEGISSESLEAYSKYLPIKVQGFIEFFCAPEMRLLNYKAIECPSASEQFFKDGYDNSEAVRNTFPANYSSDSRRLADERQRLHMLEVDIVDLNEQRKWFIAPEAYAALKACYP